jgi:glycosyltransferase involved in cell wall biosynthesis
MKILIPVDPEVPVPPELYGGIERIVDGLITEYKKSGHVVILLANDKSTSNDAAEIYGWPALHSRGTWNVLKNTFKLYKTAIRVKPDVIHSFSRLLYLYPLFIFSKIPIIMSYGRHISHATTTLAAFLGGKKINFTGCGEHMFNHISRFRNKFYTIYNFTLTDYFTPDTLQEKEYMMFLSRIEHIKGTKEAVQVALKTGKKLLIAGNITEGHEEYFEQYVKPYIDNENIIYVGPVNDEQKRDFLRKASVLLFPVNIKESFGIVMAEALSCGVPVIAFDRGAVPEIVIDGFNGFVVSNVDEMVIAVSQIGSLDPNAIRKDCVHRFSRNKIALQYIGLIRNLYKL